MRLGKRLVKFLFWGAVLSLSILAGAAWFAYAFVTDSDTAARLIKAQVSRFLPRSLLDLGRVRIRPFTGEVTVSQIHLRQWIDGNQFLTTRIPWLHVRLDPRQLLSGRIEAREVIVSQPTLSLCKRKDGSWNLQGLVADPWPAQAIKDPPPILIRNGTVNLVFDENPDSEASPPPSSPSSTPLPGVEAARKKEAKPGSETAKAVLTSAGAETPKQGSAILRDVSMRIEQTGEGRLRFEGTARGDVFDRVTLEGSIDVTTGEVTLGGELLRLTLSENLHRRIPPEIIPTVDALGLTGGEIDLELNRLEFHPKAPIDNRWKYDVVARLRGGVWECPSLPFPVHDLWAILAIRDGQVTVKHAEGYNGTTTLRGEGTVLVGDPDRCPFDLRVDLLDLQLDKRLRDRTPAQYDELWDIFKPRGRVSAYLHLVRQEDGGPMGVGATVLCRDMAAVYRHFAYPLDHLNGKLTLEKQTIKVDLQTLIGLQPARLTGTIENPGPDAVVRLDLQADSVPIDTTFLAALPPDVRKVVDQFQPSGSVKAAARIFRKPMVGPDAHPEGHLAVDADLRLNPRCEITWAGLPYPIRNLTGRLKIHPDRWEFENMRGGNGQAVITGNGQVEKLPGPNQPNGDPPLKIHLELKAQNLPFDNQLRSALPLAWQKTWSIINPSGASDVDATIHIEPDRPDVNHIVILPRPESSVRLQVERTPYPPYDPGGTIELPMENVLGRFVFDNGKVAMQDGRFLFRGSPVQFRHGEVQVENSGRFALSVNDLFVKEVRFDSGLRKIMPPLMSQFALRLDDGRFTARGDLQIGWSGVADEPAWCKWDNTLVVFNDNTIKTGIPLEHIQGQLDHVRGWSNGLGLEVHGVVQLESVSLQGQQITQLESPFHVERGTARLESIRGRLLGGELLGNASISLDATPKYTTSLRLNGAELQEYARTLPGRQSFRGVLNASIECNGLGNDVRSLQGKGEAHITEGDLGQLPVVLRFASALNSTLAPQGTPRTPGKAAFDSADLEFRIVNGETIFDPIKFTGSGVSLLGRGTRDALGNLDLRLKILYGRDRFHMPVLSDLIREASGQFFIVRIVGTFSNPKPKLEALPQVNPLGARRGERSSE